MSEVTPLKTLIIDDSPEDRVAYKRYLKRCSGFDMAIAEAATLDQGIQEFGNMEPNCVLLDFSLPDGDGIEFLKNLPDSGGRSDSFVIFLTEYGNEELVVKALSMGAADYIPKRSVNEQSLSRSINSAFEKMELRAQIEKEQAEKDRVIAELRQALDEVKRLSSLLPICAHCKNIRNDDGYWEAVDRYFATHAGTSFTHGICPDCLKTHFNIDHKDHPG